MIMKSQRIPNTAFRYLDAKNIGKLCNLLGFSLCDNKIIMKVEMIRTIE